MPRPALRLFRALPEAVRQRAVRAASPSYTLGAQARITRDDGRILLVKAAYRWRWGMPGGLMDPGESPAEAAVRETLEETGLDIILTSDPVVVVETTLQRVNFLFTAAPAPGADPDAITPQVSEILELGWFAPEALPETVPNISDELFLQHGALEDGRSVIVTSGLSLDRPNET